MMKKLKNLSAFLRSPGRIFLCCVWALTLLSIAGSALLITFGYESWPVYIVFACTAILFAYSIYGVVRSAVPAAKAWLAERAKRHAFTNNLISSYSFRTIAFSVVSFVINVGFALFNAVLAILVLSPWYGIFACYYFFLSALRCLILVGSYKAKKRSGSDAALFYEYKLRLYRLCGILLFVLELALAAAVTLMILSERPARTSEIMAIASAAYTFYKIIFAAVHLVKVQRLRDPMLQCFRNINFTDAAVSLLSLQVTLIAVFSGRTEFAMEVLNAVTGFAVCAVTVFLGVFMIVRASGRLKALKRGEPCEGQGQGAPAGCCRPEETADEGK